MQDQNPKTQNPVPNVPTVAQSAAGVAAAQVAQKPAQQTTAQASPKISQADLMKKIVGKIRDSENILVALSRDPSVDEIAAAIGLTLFLDGLQKHTTAIYSGETPSTLAFLQPEGTFETNTDSLRDFIIALSKDKADHLRYKLDGDFVKVYITPYKTTLNESDLEFTYGDFNVNLVLGLGIPTAGDLDEALAEYGRIMHDATTVDITVDVPGRFAEIEWSDSTASSVSEMVTKLIFALQGQDAVLDKDVATALLTGIVAATGRFSNNKTNSDTMQLASKLMAMGADQQLISANVMDNDGNRPTDVSYDAGAAINEVDLPAATTTGYDYSGMVPAEAAEEVANMPQMTTATEVTESPIVEPVIPDLLKATDDDDRAAVRTAAAAAVSEAVASATASAAAVGATGVGVPQAQNQVQGAPVVATTGGAVVQDEQPKDYARMMEQALAETGTATTAAGRQVITQSTVGGAGTDGQVTMEQRPTPVAEPVAKEQGVVLPPPPEPVATGEMMPPVLPEVKVPNE